MYFTTNFTSNYIKNFVCESCDFKCSKKGDWSRHLQSRKHNTTNTTDFAILHQSIEYICECGKSYKYRGSLHNHKKSCIKSVDDVNYNKNGIKEEEGDDYKKMFITLLEKYDNLQNTLMEVIPKVGNNSTTNHNIINNDNKFNINVFLDEKCKDAMNLKDFVESIHMSISDLENIGEKGFTQSVSNIIIDKLNSLDVYHRPLHCSNNKRETLYVKDDNKWEEENMSTPKLKEAINMIANKSTRMLPVYEKTNTNGQDVKYIEIVNAVMQYPKENEKIISNIAKEVMIRSDGVDVGGIYLY